MVQTNVQGFSGDVQIRGTTFIKANSNSNNIAIGTEAGETSQGTNTVAVGYQAGETTQGSDGIGVGRKAGETSQGTQSIAVGVRAGQTSQGTQSIAVGYRAGETSQHDNSIVLNASGSALNSEAASRFYVKPIRSIASGGSVLTYDNSTGEIMDTTDLTTDGNRITSQHGLRFDGTSTETYNGGGGAGTVTESYHLRFNDERQLVLRWSGEDLKFKWGEGNQYNVRAQVGATSTFGFTFTGQHRNFIKDAPYQDVIDQQMGGLIVCANNNEYVKISGGIEKGLNAITQNESLPIVSLSAEALDKSCFGVISESEDPNSNRGGTLGMFKSYYDTEDGDKRVIINSLGEGAIWVTNINGSLESGDYITTSNVTGYGQKQDSEFLANYTVAKITMDCNFEPTSNPIQIIRKERSNVNYWVNTTYENVTEEEYSNLTEENRRIIDDTYQKIIKQESKTEQEGYTPEVRQEMVNVLDEHGQIQWEDDPSGATEKSYKIRYLDANGNITNESNYVYKAAYVGCTYHCG